MPIYKHILFDLDHTLWDFDTNCSETLAELYATYAFKTLGIDESLFIKTYKQINHRMWHEYHRGIITKEAIRNNRFTETFKQLDIPNSHLPPDIHIEFMKLCPLKGHLIPFARELLTYLQPKYKIHIVTNGFKESQHLKISASNLGPFIHEVVNSEICGYLKPDRKIFEYTLAKIGATCSECVMIGDDLEADVLGAKNFGMDHVFLNRHNELHTEELTYEIKCLSELFTIL